jgi:hypothetical protein
VRCALTRDGLIETDSCASHTVHTVDMVDDRLSVVVELKHGSSLVSKPRSLDFMSRDCMSSDQSK